MGDLKLQGTGRELIKPRVRKWRRYQPFEDTSFKMQEQIWMRETSKTGERYFCNTARLLYPKSHWSVPLFPLSHWSVPLILFPFLSYPHTILVLFRCSIFFLVYPEDGGCMLFQILVL
jgi:hypothetical protein